MNEFSLIIKKRDGTLMKIEEITKDEANNFISDIQRTYDFVFVKNFAVATNVIEHLEIKKTEVDVTFGDDNSEVKLIHDSKQNDEEDKCLKKYVNVLSKEIDKLDKTIKKTLYPENREEVDALIFRMVINNYDTDTAVRIHNYLQLQD